MSLLSEVVSTVTQFQESTTGTLTTPDLVYMGVHYVTFTGKVTQTASGVHSQVLDVNTNEPINLKGTIVTEIFIQSQHLLVYNNDHLTQFQIGGSTVEDVTDFKAFGFGLILASLINDKKFFQYDFTIGGGDFDDYPVLTLFQENLGGVVTSGVIYVTVKCAVF